MNQATPPEKLPFEKRDDSDVQGHWLLARLGKRVLRPGGIELTRKLLDQADITHADVVIGEAMLTMQGEKTKDAIISEAVRLLRPGGRYAIHELGLAPDNLPDTVKTEIRQALARSIKVNARPLTLAEWSDLLSRHGLVVDQVATAPMALLQPRRLVADEALLGALRFARNLLTHPQARRRVLAMRQTFRANRQYLTAVAIVAHKPAAEVSG